MKNTLINKIVKFSALAFFCVALPALAAAPVIPAFGDMASRTTCTAPCAVFFDATGTTDADLVAYDSQAYHELSYSWSFGDSAAGNWAFGANTALRKNGASGPVAAHVFETAGTYTVAVDVTDGANTTRRTGTVTVTAADTTYATTATVCFYNSTVGSGCPAGATETPSVDFDTAMTACVTGNNRRCLFKRGDTFPVSAASTISYNGITIGAYGSGAKPVIDLQYNGKVFIISGGSTPTVNDVTIMDLAVNGNSWAAGYFLDGGGSFSRLTIKSVDVTNVSFGVRLSASVLTNLNYAASTTLNGAVLSGANDIVVTNASGFTAGNAIQVDVDGEGITITTIANVVSTTITLTDPLNANAASGRTVDTWVLPFAPTDPMWDQVFIVDSTFTGLVGTNNSGNNMLFLNATRLAVLGNSINNQGTGTAFGGEHGMRFQWAQKSVISNNTVQGINTGKTNMTMRGLDFEGTSITAAGSYNEYIVVSNNKFIGSAYQVGLLGLGPQNDSHNERIRNAIYERNWIVNGALVTNSFGIQATYVTVRNNLMSGTGANTNSLVLESSNTAGATPPNFVWVYNNTAYKSNTGNYQFMVLQDDTTNIFAKNNLAYAPLAGATVNMFQGTLTGLTESDNSSVAQVTDTNPFETTPSASNLTTFQPSTAYADDGGTAVFPATKSDFFGCWDKTGANRIGAVVPRANAICRGAP